MPAHWTISAECVIASGQITFRSFRNVPTLYGHPLRWLLSTPVRHTASGVMNSRPRTPIAGRERRLGDPGDSAANAAGLGAQLGIKGGARPCRTCGGEGHPLSQPHDPWGSGGSGKPKGYAPANNCIGQA